MWGWPARRALVALPMLVVLVLGGDGLAAPGDLDPHFGTGGIVITDVSPSNNDNALAAVLQPDGKIVAAGTSFNGGDFAVVRYNPNGTLDTGFGTGGKVSTPVGSGSDFGNAVALQPDGKIVVAGQAMGSTNLDVAVVRYLPNGLLDSGFGSGGQVITPIGTSDDVANSVAIQPDGKIVVAGTASGAIPTDDVAVVRYTTTGALDGTFGSGGKVVTSISPGADGASALALQPDGKIVVAGITDAASAADFALVRYTAAGALDGSFGSGGKVTTSLSGGTDDALGLALQPDGKIVAGGLANSDFGLARYNQNGTLDASFGSGGTVTTDVAPGHSDVGRSVALQPDGKIVLGGFTVGAPSPEDFAAVRYDPDGSLDGSFGAGGIVITDPSPGHINEGHAVVVQPDGNILLAGRADNGPSDTAVVRYLGWGVALSAQHVGPGGIVTVRGQGFRAHEPVDVYLDTTDLALAVADGLGDFHVDLTVPAGTQPGVHWVTAVGRASLDAYQASLTVGADWPMLQFGPEHSGTNPFETGLSPGNVKHLKVLRRTALAPSGTHQTPAELGGVVYAVGSTGILAGIDATTGGKVWTSLQVPGASPPAVDGNAVVVGSTDGYAHGLDPGSGDSLWTRNLSSGTGGPAAIANGVAYLGTTTGKVWAIDTLTGVRVPSWTVFTAGGGVGGAPAVADGVVYFGASDGKVYALDASSGAAIGGWPVVASATANFASSPAVDGGSLFIAGQDSKLYALDAETGAPLWTGILGGASTSSPSVVDGTVYVGANDGKVYAFDEDTGASLWSTQLGGPVGSSPAVANGVVYATVQSKKKLFALDAGTGAKLRTIATKTNPSSAIVANGDVYVSGTTGLQAFGLGPPHPAARPDPRSLVPDPRLG
jgi:uncharacterized delta-60 repeat protein